MISSQDQKKIHSSLKDDEQTEHRAAKIHENNFTHFTPKVKTVTSMILYYQVTSYSKRLEQIQHFTGYTWEPLDRASYFHTLERATFKKQSNV